MTKKHAALLFPLLLLLSGCETADKVSAFWAGQLQKLLMTPYGTVFMASAMQYAAKTQQGLAQLDLPAGTMDKMPWDKMAAQAQAAQKFQASAQQQTPSAKTVSQTPAKHNRPAAKQQAQQFMEISIEDDTPEFTGAASVKDQQTMRKSIDFIKSSNQQALTDVQRLMGNTARDEVLALNTRTEKKLEKASLQAKTLKQYQQQQNAILQQHKQQFQKILAKYQRNINSRAVR